MPRGGRKRDSKLASYEVREVVLDDMDHGFLQALAGLGDTRGLSPREARRILLKVSFNPFHKIFVALKDGAVVGTTTLIIEQKFIHNGGLVGHIEDVSVRKDQEGRGVGGALVSKALEAARQYGCYKCILDCKENLIGFYERLGFRKHEIEMRKDLR